jgi:hypothetical protein
VSYVPNPSNSVIGAVVLVASVPREIPSLTIFFLIQQREMLTQL